MVAPGKSVRDRGAHLSSGTRPVSVHRCQPVRMGSTLGTSRSNDFGVLASKSQGPHKSSRTKSYQTRTSRIPSTSSIDIGHGSDRQLDSRVLHSPPRRHPLSHSVRGNGLSSQLVLDSQSSTPSETHSGETQCPGRQTLSPGRGSSSGMVSRPNSSEQSVRRTGSPIDRSVRFLSELQASDLRLSRPRTKGRRKGRPLDELGQPVRVRVSAIQHGITRTSETSSVHSQTHSDSTSVATAELVPRPPSVLVRRSGGSPSDPTPGLAVQGSDPPPQLTGPQPSRLAVVRKSLRQRNFSERASRFIQSSRRLSTCTVYDAKWRVYTSWCSQREIDPCQVSIPVIADFFVFLFEDKGLFPSTIKGYRSMLSLTLRSVEKEGGADIGSDTFLSELIRSFELARPRSSCLVPKWDLACVLLALTKAPFEPLHSTTVSFLTWKTVFLLTFASAKRCSEIHSLSVEDGYCRFNSDGSVTLLSQPGFLAKTQLPSVASQPFTIPSLANSCGSEDPDRTLCPVRALKHYLARVKSIRKGRKRLFIPTVGDGDICKSSISRWIASVIRRAYKDLSPACVRLLKIKAHELRALSTSWAFINRSPLEEILRASYWKSSSTFSNFYLRSFAQQTDNISALGPLVAAQHVINARL